MKLLDLFCGAGGASMGYHLAGFEVVGVDINPQPHYPFKFIQMDALEADLDGFDAIHASPPCKTHTSLKKFSAAHHVDLIPQTREKLRASGLPWVMENVVGAPLENPIMLCGSMFGLDVERHRLFESSFELEQLPCRHDEWKNRYPVKRYHSGKPEVTMSPVVGVYGGGQGLGKGEVNLWRKVMQIDWMVRNELSQALPPAYTKWIGERLMRQL